MLTLITYDKKLTESDLLCKVEGRLMFEGEKMGPAVTALAILGIYPFVLIAVLNALSKRRRAKESAAIDEEIRKRNEETARMARHLEELKRPPKYPYDKLIIAVMGKPSCGKSVLSKMLIAYGEEQDLFAEFARVSSGEVLVEMLKPSHGQIPTKRKVLQSLVQWMESVREGTLASIMEERIKALHTPVVIYDGFRLPTDAAMVAKFTRVIPVYVYAHQRDRYEWARHRKEKAGEGELTWEEFLEEDTFFTESHVERLAVELCAVRVSNMSTLANYTTFLKNFIDTTLPEIHQFLEEHKKRNNPVV